MINLLNNTENTIKIRISQDTFNTFSGNYLLKFISVGTNKVYIFTQTDTSLYKNLYSTFIICKDFMDTLETGQYELYISDLTDTETILYKNMVEVYEEKNDNNSYFIRDENINTIYDYDDEELSIPSTPEGFNVSKVNNTAKLTWFSTKSSNYYEIWRSVGKIDEDNDFIFIGKVYALSYQDNFLEDNKTYYYKIRAGNDNGFSNFTSIKIIIN
ncbi:MAG: hypothetical protein ACOC1K_00895 [Nanoarchaeota archaeon]